MDDKLKLLKAEKNGCFPIWLKDGKLGDLRGKKIWYGLNSKGETVGFYADMTAYNFKTKKTAKWGCKSLKKSEKTNNQVTSTSDKEYAIIKPKGYMGNKVHVLFGGAHTSGYSKNSANPQAIKKYVSVMTPYANNIIIVITHHMNTLGNVRAYVKEKFGGVVTSIAGFSQGGKETWKHAGDSSLNLVGLIDPSTYDTDIPFGANTILYCDPRNWGTTGFYGQTRKRLEWYCKNRNKYGNRVVCFKEGGTHMNFQILKSFYENYGNKM
jgi:hypothetical protein